MPESPNKSNVVSLADYKLARDADQRVEDAVDDAFQEAMQRHFETERRLKQERAKNNERTGREYKMRVKHKSTPQDGDNK